MKPKKPKPVKRLWGIWLPHGGADSRGCWIQHGQGPCDGPEAYTSERDAKEAATYWNNDCIGYEGCYAAILCESK